MYERNVNNFPLDLAAIDVTPIDMGSPAINQRLHDYTYLNVST
jgi:uncharacterized protein (DUF2344 family)